MDQREWIWPPALLAALRLGRRLAVLVPASQPHRWSFVHIVPSGSAGDAIRADPGRSFLITHWEYEADRLEGYDHDLGVARIRRAEAADEGELLAVLREWRLPPERFGYSWDTVDPC
ncbi:hypothetical protein [Actinoplanes sp. NPDC051851]|uniref:hypothetical protein n=1 Tax=Actinoplanes sp. NPDC051851 TaxID=3154753 RepID=UPI003421A2F6